MPAKHCAWGTCNSDSRYRESCEGVRFVPFTKPKQGLQKCIRWIKACEWPQIQFNVGKITKWTYIGTKLSTSILFSWCVVRIINVSNAGLPAPLSLYGVHSASLAGCPRLVRSAQSDKRCCVAVSVFVFSSVFTRVACLIKQKCRQIKVISEEAVGSSWKILCAI